MNLFDFAMQMELEGKEYYEKLKAETPIVGIQKIFSILAADEQKHYEVLYDMKLEVEMEMTDSTALEQAKDIFKFLQINEAQLGKLRSKKDAYQHAVLMEADSIKLYEDIARQETENGNLDIVPLVVKIIREEQEHYNIMQNIHDYNAAYERMIPWREFSAIKEFKSDE